MYSLAKYVPTRRRIAVFDIVIQVIVEIITTHWDVSRFTAGAR